MIKNLPRQLNEAGKIKIGRRGAMITSSGGKKFRPPKKLDHFQLVTTEKDANGDYIVDVDLQNKIKESGTGIVNKDGCLIGLPIRLLYNDTELNFPHRYVSYVSGKMSCHGDGEVSHKRVDNFKKDHTCPCARVEQGYQGTDKCKPTGTLTCVIDEAGLFGQAHKFRTTSMNTIKGILGGIELIKTATNGKIAGLPLMLTMNAKQTTTPQGISTTVYIVSICYRGSMADLRQETLELLSTEKQYLISMDEIESDAKRAGVVDVLDAEDERDFVEEFFPDAVVVDAGDKGGDDAKVVGSDDADAVAIGNDPEGIEEAKSTAPVVEPEKTEETTDTPKHLVEPVGTYKKIYDQFVVETDLEKAFSFAKRLQKGNLLYWLDKTYRDIEFEPNIKKPEALELVYNVLKSTLPASPTDSAGTAEETTGTEAHDSESISEKETRPEHQTAETEAQEPEPEPEPESFPREWDKSGPIEKEQLRTLVHLKTTLEQQGTLQPDKWVDQVSYFLDADGNAIKKAIKLTIKQGENFIRMLSKLVKEDESMAA